MDHRLIAAREAQPASVWRSLYHRLEDGYRRWFLKEGDAARPSYGASQRALKKHMPELLPLYHQLVELAGGSDTAARMLSLYRPTPYLTGCSQAVWGAGRPGSPFLVRNYDYSPRLWDGVLLHSSWTGRPVVAMLDSLWGVLDGINSDGLVVSLAFGGRKAVGDGFGMPLILRYVLETCATTAEACQVLARVPTNMSYNVTVLDAQRAHATAFLAPDRPPQITHSWYATNHQHRVEWPAYAAATGTLDRERYLMTHLSNPSESPGRFVERFMEPPLYSDRFSQGWGTLYTAVYHPTKRSAEYRWPGTTLSQTIDQFHVSEVRIRFPESRHAG